jgi:hypothetical protein
MQYYKSFQTEKIVRNSSVSPTMTFIIGKTYFETLGRDKNPERYRLFFNEKYLGEEGRK